MSLSSVLTLGCSLDRHYIYYPTALRKIDWASESGLPLKDIYFKAEDGVELHGWYVPAPNSRAVFLWCHGNAGNISDRLHNISFWYKRGISIFIFDYRGYGKSKGVPNEKGLYKDVVAAYNVLVKEVKLESEKIVIFGRSLGASVAGYLATREKSAGLILETPFSSVKAMARAYYGSLPVHLLLQSRYPLIDYVHNIDTPLLVIHGDQDQIVPFSQGRQVYEAANEPKSFYTISGAGHNDTYIVGGDAYFDRIQRFIDEFIGKGEVQ